MHPEAVPKKKYFRQIKLYRLVERFRVFRPFRVVRVQPPS